MARIELHKKGDGWLGKEINCMYTIQKSSVEVKVLKGGIIYAY